jgi:hypothetical protein
VVWLGVNLWHRVPGGERSIGQFELHDRPQVVALAVLMPIVAGVGGNAGTCRCSTLMVRGLALGQVGAVATSRMLLWKELAGGVAQRRDARHGGGASSTWSWFRRIRCSSLVIGAGADRSTCCAAALRRCPRCR